MSSSSDRRAVVCAALIGFAACGGGNFTPVAVTAVPCRTTAMRVTVQIDNEEPQERFFADAELFADLETSFVIDFGDRSAGEVTVDVAAFDDFDRELGRFVETYPFPIAKIELDLGGFGFAPTNFDPCEDDFPPAEAPIETAATMTTIDTTDATYEGGKIGAPIMIDGVECLLVHVASLRVEAGHTLQINGNRPLLIVSEGDVVIRGLIEYSIATLETTGCVAGAFPSANGTSGGGGGGGGLAERGGDGGVRSDGAGGSDGTSSNAQLPALRMGCPGIAGAGDGGGGPGGAGGGIQITSRTVIALETGGAIYVNGGGGGGGQGMNNNFAGGGGGGGSAGTILLEAPLIVLEPATELCAVGGGGGQAGRRDRTAACPNGLDGSCGGGDGGANCTSADPAPASAGAGGNAGGELPPRPGAAAISASVGGGGGGGDAGRIHFVPHGDLRGDPEMMTVSPEPTLPP